MPSTTAAAHAAIATAAAIAAAAVRRGRKRDDVLPFAVRSLENAPSQRGRRGRAFHRERERRGGSLELGQLPAAPPTVGQMRLEPLAILPRQRVEGIEG